MVMYGI